MMRFASLGSGSSGNALIVEAGTTRIMLDCGFGLRDAVARLGRLGLEPSGLDAVIVTHEHADHVGGVARLARKYRLAVWITPGTLAAVGNAFAGCERVHLIERHARFDVGAIEMLPYPVPHDAREPAQFVFSDGARRLGVLTDAGSLTPQIEGALERCEALVLECNHDVDMLHAGPYSPALKHRIAGPLGHLDNRTAARLLARAGGARLQHVVAAHLSRKNNTPELARAALAAALGCSGDWIGVACQVRGFGWRELH